MGKAQIVHSGQLMDLLQLRHPDPQWAFFPELRNGTGYSRQPRTIDAMAFNVWPSGGGYRVAYEVKVDRRDFLRELADPQKRKWVEDCCHETWFVAPAGLIKPDELPLTWGLLEATKNVKQLRKKKIAPPREPSDDFPYVVTLSVLRQAARQLEKARTRTFEFEGETITPGDLEKIVNGRVAHLSERLAEKLDRAREAEDAAQDERARYSAPLARLHQLAVNRNWVRLPTPLKSEDIDTWIEQAVAHKVEAAMGQIREVHKATGRLIETMKGKKNG